MKELTDLMINERINQIQSSVPKLLIVTMSIAILLFIIVILLAIRKKKGSCKNIVIISTIFIFVSIIVIFSSIYGPKQKSYQDDWIISTEKVVKKEFNRDRVYEAEGYVYLNEYKIYLQGKNVGIKVPVDDFNSVLEGDYIYLISNNKGMTLIYNMKEFIYTGERKPLNQSTNE